MRVKILPMAYEDTELHGRHVRLEPLAHRHADALLAAASVDRSLYRWSPVPADKAEVRRYIELALAARQMGTALPFATVRVSDGVLIGSTRFFDMERWAWPAEHAAHGRSEPDVCEIGYTWLTLSAVRTAANTEAKLLMLTHAFESWGALRVCLHTDARNQRSRSAIERIGAQFEGVLRSHRMAADFSARDSARYSILASEWPAVRTRLRAALAGH
jgi:RimJ/RimL family protein N-acetyltransferase